MKKFKFDLQPLLGHRKRKEDGLKRELADVRRQLAKETKLLNKLHTELGFYQEELKGKQKKKFNPDEITVYHKYFNRMQKVIENQNIIVEEFIKEVEKKREELMNASKEKKAIENLKDKKHSSYIKLARNEEQKIIDEVATMRYGKENSNLQ